MSQDQKPFVLPMYTEITRLKQVFRHIEGVPIPLPVPVTVSGIMTGIMWIVLVAKWIPWVDPLTKYVFFPIILVCVISYFEPEGMSPFSWIYAKIRSFIRPQRRIINRSVPQIGYLKEYVLYSIIRR